MHSTVIYDSARRKSMFREGFASARSEPFRGLELRSSLVWDEHCSECVWPSCYATCALYTPRGDLKCRRFVHGIELVTIDRHSYGAFAVSFRTWGKLEAEGRVRLSSRFHRRLQHGLDELAGRVLDHLPIPFAAKVAATTKWNKLKSKLWAGSQRINDRDAFAVECYNQNSKVVNFRIKIIDPHELHSYFESHFSLAPGYNYLTFGVDRISHFINLDNRVRVQIDPVDHDAENYFVFSLLDFVRLPSESHTAHASAPRHHDESENRRNHMVLVASSPLTVMLTKAASLPKVKCVVWDLDDTIWNGVLIEDGPRGIKLRQEVVQIIEELDRRGIIQSIASKNDRKEAEEALKHFRLIDYFVFPQIHWQSKSQSIGHIAKMLNIGLDTFIFIDDQAFEREEVRAAHASVRVADAANLQDLLRRADFDVPATAESARRRIMYKEEETRTLEFGKSDGNFIEFLRGSQLKLKIQSLNDETMARAFELTQRTNQLNYGGRQLSRSDLEEITSLKTSRRGLVLSCGDRFGDYGIIGFAVVDVSDWLIEDFFMSCRVQRKKVENAFIAHLAAVAKMQGGGTLRVRFRPSKRNASALETLKEMEFKLLQHADDEYTYAPPVTIPHTDLVGVEDTAESLFLDILMSEP